MRACPRCALLNPENAERCDCGFRFLENVRPMPFAGFWIRFLADVYDGCIALAIAIPLYYFFDKPVLGAQRFLRLENWDEVGLSHIVMWAAFLYNMTYLVSKTGQSFGRKMVGISVTDARTGKCVGFFRTLARNLFAGLISVIFYVGFLWLLVDRRKQTWHDKLFSTVVMYSV